MTNFEKIKYYYQDRKLYKDFHMIVFVQKNILTEEEYEEITGTPFVGD